MSYNIVQVFSVAVPVMVVLMFTAVGFKIVKSIPTVPKEKEK